MLRLEVMQRFIRTAQLTLQVIDLCAKELDRLTGRTRTRLGGAVDVRICHGIREPLCALGRVVAHLDEDNARVAHLLDRDATAKRLGRVLHAGAFPAGGIPKNSGSRFKPRRVTTRSATARLPMMRFCVSKNSRFEKIDITGEATSSTFVPSGRTGLGSYSIEQTAS